ncbi:ATP-dependent nuclease, subunit A [Streptococcus sp. DD11]|nr:ATP-dependent nuclease, subunit A [Streptococcus sp. DD11]
MQADDAVKQQVNLDKIAAFFDSDLGKLLIQHKDKLRREAPFAMLKTDDASGQKFVVRGILDGYLLFADRIVLFDYKTDKFRHPSELTERYRSQLTLYAEALSRSYGISAIEKYLVLLGGEELLVVKAE